jgi:hypothetical protein
MGMKKSNSVAAKDDYVAINQSNKSPSVLQHSSSAMGKTAGWVLDKMLSIKHKKRKDSMYSF